MSTAARTPAEDAEFRGRSGGGGRVGTKPFERALLRLNAAVGVSLPGPSTQTHPLSGGAPASASLRIVWSEMHPALHPDWLAQRENLDARIKERQAQRTALRSERKAQHSPCPSPCPSLCPSPNPSPNPNPNQVLVPLGSSVPHPNPNPNPNPDPNPNP